MTRTRRSVLATVGASLVAGCSGLNVVGGGAARSATLLLNWKPNGLHVPYYAARAQGFYGDAGVEVDAIDPGQGSDFSAQQAGLGNSEFAVTSSDQVLLVNSRDLSPLSVATVMQRSPVVLFTAREQFGERLTEPAQLADARVGTGPGMVRILTELYLEHHGIRSSVELVDTGYDTVQQLLTGTVDAAGGVFGDAIATRHQDATVDSLRVASAIPSYGHVLATDPAYAESNPDEVRGFLEATARGAAWAHRNPTGAVDALVDANEALAESRSQERAKWEALASTFMLSSAVDRHGWGWSQREPWTVTRDALDGADLLESDVDPGSAWTNEYLPTDTKYVGSYVDQIPGQG